MQTTNPATVRPFQKYKPEIGSRVYIDAAATVVGKVVLGDDVSLWPGVVVRGDVNRIEIGQRSNIQDLCCLHVTHDGPYTPGGRHLEVGASVTIGHGVILHACSVGDFSLVGMGSILMDDVIVAPRCMVAAGSLLSPGTETESGVLYRGRPAKPARPLTDDELEQLVYSADHYVRLKDRYLEANY